MVLMKLGLRRHVSKEKTKNHGGAAVQCCEQTKLKLGTRRLVDEIGQVMWTIMVDGLLWRCHINQLLPGVG